MNAQSFEDFGTTSLNLQLCFLNPFSCGCCWVTSKWRSFEVKFYRVLPSAEYFFPWKNIWRCKDPLRVTFFTWTTFLGRISHYGQSPQASHHSDRLVICVHKEWQNSWTPPSSLWYCKKLVELSFGVEWVIPRWVVELVACWKRRFSRNDFN